jgi:hypothetical protein
MQEFHESELRRHSAVNIKVIHPIPTYQQICVTIFLVFVYKRCAMTHFYCALPFTKTIGVNFYEHIAGGSADRNPQ